MGEKRTADLYVPILKGKQGELNALSNIGAESANLIPLLEVVPSGMDDADPQEAAKDIARFADRLAISWTMGEPVFLDAGLLPDDLPLAQGWPPIQHLLVHAEARGVRGIPVVRTTDSAVTRSAVRAALTETQQGSVCLRLGPDDTESDEAAPEELIDRLLEDLSVSAADAHLVVDFGVLADEGGIRLASRMARYLLGDIPHLEDWQSFTLAAGAFPSALTDVQASVFAEIPRTDWLFWRDTTERLRLGRHPGFGDYAIANPSIAQGAAFAPAPQIRYTADEHWLILRGRKGVRRGSQQFYDICARIVERAEYAGRDFSWGDEYIWQAAQSAPDSAVQLVGPGNASTWRSVATSHHLAKVVDQLTNPSES